jgi:fatty acid hydroxylase family protein
MSQGDSEPPLDDSNGSSFNKSLLSLDKRRSLIEQAYTMRSRDFDRIKDNVIKPTLKDNESLLLLPYQDVLGIFEFTTKAPVWMHAVTWIPLCVYVWAALMKEHTPVTFMYCLCGSVVTWPLTEYVLHRFLFHFPVLWADGLLVSGVVNVIRLLVHTVHHAHPTDKMRIVTPLPLSLPVAALLLGPIVYYCPPRNLDLAYAWCTGMILGYVLYDMIHYYMHFGRPSELPDWLGPVKTNLRALHVSHANHHYSKMGHTESFGVSDTRWDYVFGTAKKRC